MVRAIALQRNPSGTYYNLSQGVFTSATVSGGIPPIWIQVSVVAGGVSLAWSSQPGAAYHVEASDSPAPPSWQNVSGTVQGGGTTTVWVDTNATSASRRFYRVLSP